MLIAVYLIAGAAARLSDICRSLARTAAAAGVGGARLLLRSGAVRGATAVIATPHITVVQVKGRFLAA